MSEASVATAPRRSLRAVYLRVALALTVSIGCAGAAAWVMLRSATARRSTATVDVRAPDLRAVDPTDLVRQAALAVRQRGEDCELTFAYVGEVRAGSLDATRATSHLSWSCRAAQDKADESWTVRFLSGRLVLSKAQGSRRHSPPWTEPICPFTRAWQAAVASGLPFNTTVRLSYRDSVWLLFVPEQPEHTRQVDGASCQVVGPPR
jgi:hypothetical protein